MMDEINSILSVALNEIHKTSYSKRFWMILIGPYITSIIYNRKILENDILNLKPSKFLFTNTLIPDKKKILFYKIQYLFKILTSLGSFRKLKLAFNKFQNIAFGFHEPELIVNEVDVYLKTIYPFLGYKINDNKKREVLLKFKSNFSENFILNIIKLIPKIYIEYFDGLLNSVPLVNPKDKIFHVSFIGSFYMRFILAKYTEHESKLFYYQHGGSYGEFEYKTAHHYESSIADQFMTWGWKIKENDVPYKAFRLERFYRNYYVKNKKHMDILMIYPIINNNNIDRIKQESAYFFKRVNRTKYPNICARPRPTARFNRKSVLNFMSKDVNKIDSGYTKIFNLISKSKLVVILTYPSTTMLECFYVDQPAIALLNSNNFPSTVVSPYYDFFVERGVFHKSIDTMVEHLNTKNIEDWWNELIKEPMYLKFKNTFLRKV